MAPRTPAKSSVAPQPKKTVKKVVSKKVATKLALSIPIEVSDDFAFWAIDGQVFHSLAALARGLKAMQGRVYRYHADSEYQDFAKWVGEVLGEKACAKKLLSAKTAVAAAKVIDTYNKSHAKK